MKNRDITLKNKKTRTIPLCGHGTVSDNEMLVLLMIAYRVRSFVAKGCTFNRWPMLAHEQRTSSNSSY